MDYKQGNVLSLQGPFAFCFLSAAFSSHKTLSLPLLSLFPAQVADSWVNVTIDGNCTSWFVTQNNMVKKVVSDLPVHFQVSYKESSSDGQLTICGSEIFYIPRRFVGDFIDLVGLVGDLDIHQKVALPLFFMSMDTPQNFDSDALASSIYKKDLSVNNSSLSYYTAQVPAVYPVNVRNEIDFIKLIRVMSAGDPLLMELV